MEIGVTRNSSSVMPTMPPSAGVTPGLSNAHLILIEVLAVLALFTVLVILPISVILLLILRKRRRSNRDESGGRVVRMIPSEHLAGCRAIGMREPVQAHNVPITPRSTGPPQIYVSDEEEKMIESYYSFELEVEDDDHEYDDVVYPSSPDENKDVVDLSLFYERIRTVSRTYHYYSDIDCHNSSVHYYEDSQLSNSYQELSSIKDEWDDDEYDDTVEENYVEPPSKEILLMEQIQQMDISQTIKLSDLNLSKVLGRGQFGSVHRGVWCSAGGELSVAVKALRNNISGRNHIKFLKECYIMAQFDHPNIVQLLGVVCEHGSTHNHKYMVLELLGRGDLRLFLRNVLANDKATLAANPQKVHSQLLQFTRHIVAGMRYLSSKGFVHRDLAARNIFISEDMICKIGDFGLACDVSGQNSSKKDKVPIPLRWAAIEVLEDTNYSASSDVWSFGVVLFEMWSLGKKPYGEMDNVDVITYVFSGQRLPPPTGCPKPIYRTMISCWHPRPASRPSFSVLQSIFKKDDKSLTHFLPEEPSLVHPKANVLGEGLEYASNLYPSLQHSYTIPNSYTMPRC